MVLLADRGLAAGPMTEAGALRQSVTWACRLVPVTGRSSRVPIDRHVREWQHPLVIVEKESPREETGVRKPFPPSTIFAELSDPRIALAAMRPAGSPVMAWDVPGRRHPNIQPSELFLRLHNSADQDITCKLRLLHFAGKAWRASSAEKKLGSLDVQDGAIEITIEAGSSECMIARVRPRQVNPNGPALNSPRPDAAASESWMSGSGEGFSGNGVFNIAARQRTVDLDGVSRDVVLDVWNNNRRRPLNVDLTVKAPPGIDTVIDPARVKAGPNESASCKLTLTPTSTIDTRNSRVTVLARSGYSWSVVETLIVNPIAVQHVPEVQIDVPLVNPGESNEIRASVANLSDSAITGEATWLVPAGSWGLTGELRRRVTLPPGGQVDFALSEAAAGSRPCLLRFVYPSGEAYSTWID
jgi:hypothetical protein